MNRRLQEGIRLFNSQRYFDAHEVFEDLWREQRGEPRDFYKGLVQACAALVQHGRGRRDGAARLMRRSLGLLAAPVRPAEPADWQRLMDDLRLVLEALEEGGAFNPPAIHPAGRL